MQIGASFISKLYKKLPVIAFDTISIPLAWYLSYWLRYNMQPFPHHLKIVNDSPGCATRMLLLL